MIDFAIIGAQKAGTTALHEYLKNHPDINLPVNKEAAYFLQDLPWRDFYQNHYIEKRGSTKIGSISPQYMCGLSCVERITQESPNLKIVGLLRDPLTRAYSHYQMNLRRNRVTNGFVDEVKRCFANREKVEFGLTCERDAMLRWGEYGRILKPFYETFSKEQILLLDYQEFKNNPEPVFKSICSHLGVNTEWVPKNLGKKFHVGGNETVLPSMSFWTKRKLIKGLWKALLSKKIRSRLKFWYEVNNVKQNREGMEFSAEVKDLFLQYYESDKKKVGEVEMFFEKWFEEWMARSQQLTNE